MGIRLDWEIEAEQGQIKSAGEDVVAVRRRRIARLRLLVLMLIIVLILGGIAAAITWRLQAVDEQIAQLLRNTMDAEMAALRIGDEGAFLAAQRSASEEWLQQQTQVFDDYQQMKLQQDVQLTGQILGMTISDNRARVEVQEIIEGVPYSRIWFYWRYDDGWRHVPPDYTFWGDVQTFEGQSVKVRYQTVDALLASSIGENIERWLQTGCEALTCDQPPEVSVDILPDDALQVSWSPNDPWALQVPSPYVRQARSDMPFNVEMQFSVANLLAERLVAVESANIQPVYPADVYYLRQAIVSWLVGRFVQMDTNAFVIDSLAANYGAPAVGRLLMALGPSSDVSVLAGAAGVASVEQANLDWRDFLTWRLMTEDELIRRRDDANFLSLYDTRDENTRALASQRCTIVPGEIKRTVSSALLEASADGLPTLRASVEVVQNGTIAQEEVLFRLVDGVWRRAN
jgi:hypothetical protein